jgi:hypothetical protein
MKKITEIQSKKIAAGIANTRHSDSKSCARGTCNQAGCMI